MDIHFDWKSKRIYFFKFLEYLYRNSASLSDRFADLDLSYSMIHAPQEYLSTPQKILKFSLKCAFKPLISLNSLIISFNILRPQPKKKKAREQMNREWNNIIMSFYGLISIC